VNSNDYLLLPWVRARASSCEGQQLRKPELLRTHAPALLRTGLWFIAEVDLDISINHVSRVADHPEFAGGSEAQPSWLPETGGKLRAAHCACLARGCASAGTTFATSSIPSLTGPRVSTYAVPCLWSFCRDVYLRSFCWSSVEPFDLFFRHGDRQ
jgi:hypothetical protein